MFRVPASPDQSDATQRTRIPERVAGVDELTDHLVGRVDAAIPRQTVRARVCREFEAFDRVRVRQFVPVFVERRVRAGLRG
jgi:hypothetical protein